jgi:hypothetical protein
MNSIWISNVNQLTPEHLHLRKMADIRLELNTLIKLREVDYWSFKLFEMFLHSAGIPVPKSWGLAVENSDNKNATVLELGRWSLHSNYC